MAGYAPRTRQALAFSSHFSTRRLWQRYVVPVPTGRSLQLRSYSFLPTRAIESSAHASQIGPRPAILASKRGDASAIRSINYRCAPTLFGGAGSSSCWRGDSLDEQPQRERHLEDEHW